MSNISAPLANLIQSNIDALEDGLELLSIIAPEHYTQSVKPSFQATIGEHYRHALEHYLCFAEQFATGVISYDQRCRDQHLQEDICRARETIETLCVKLAGIDTVAAQAKQLKINDQPLTEAITTTLERELMFLLSHTVHHYAIIAAMARALGNCPPEGFGVAIATLSWQAGSEATAMPALPLVNSGG